MAGRTPAGGKTGGKPSMPTRRMMLRQTLAHLRPSRPTPAGGGAIPRDETNLPQIKMHRRHLEDLPPVNLPEGYALWTYEEGDDVHWCNILNTTSVRPRRTSRPSSPPPDTPPPMMAHIIRAPRAAAC